MSRIKKIKFVCPDCGKTELTAERIETLHHSVVPSIDLNEDHYIEDLVEEAEDLMESAIVKIFCPGCGFRVVTPEPGDKGVLDDKLLDWLEAHNMLEDMEDPK